MADSKILREYLLSLGFKVQPDQKREFDKTVKGTNINVMALGKAVLGVTTAAQALVAHFAYSMEKLYYASRRAESAAGNLQALEYGAKQIGLSGGQMTSAIEGVARAMRLNPGLKGLVESFGVRVDGRDKADVAIDFVDALRRMPFYTAAQYAGLFGIDADTLFMLFQGVEELKKAADLRKQMAADAGLDTEKAVEAGKEYAQTLREIGELLVILKDVAAIAFLPAMREVAGVTKEVLKDWTQIIRTRSAKDWKDAVTLPFSSAWDRFVEYGTPASKRKKPAAPVSFARTPGVTPDSPDYIPGIDSDPDDTVIPDSKDYIPGVDDDPSDPPRQMMLTKKGFEEFMADFNKGGGAIFANDSTMRTMLSMAENSRSYMAGGGVPVTITQQTNIQVTGDNASEIGRSVAGEQRGVNADLSSVVRNQVGAVR